MITPPFSKKSMILTTLAISAIWSSNIQAYEHWLWASEEESAINREYTPSGHYAFSSGSNYNHTGSNIRIKRIATGRYQVTINGKANGNAVNRGTAHVTAYGSNKHCKVANWSLGSSRTIIDVRCFDQAGTPANNKFSLVFYAFDPTVNDLSDAYALAGYPTIANYTPDINYQSSSQNGINTVFRSEVGSYRVTLPGMTRNTSTNITDSRTVTVTAYGQTSTQCRNSGLYGASLGQIVYVNCFNAAGSAADSAFTVSYSRGSKSTQPPQEQAHVQAYKTLDGSIALDGNSYSMTTDGRTQPITMQRVSTGNYTVRLPRGHNATGSNVQVTSSSSRHDTRDKTTYCNVKHWRSNSLGGVDIGVSCYNDRGLATDVGFKLQYRSRYVGLI